MIRVIARGLVLLLTAFPQAATGREPESRSARDVELMEAVFRYQIKNCSPDGGKKVFFLSDAGKDLSDKFMGRFKGNDPPVKKQSEIVTSEVNNEFVDKASGKSATLLRIDKIEWLSDDKAEVEGSCGFASWAAEGHKYGVVREDEKWVVKGAERTWIASTAPPNNGLQRTRTQLVSYHQSSVRAADAGR